MEGTLPGPLIFILDSLRYKIILQPYNWNFEVSNNFSSRSGSGRTFVDLGPTSLYQHVVFGDPSKVYGTAGPGWDQVCLVSETRTSVS